MAVVFFAAFLTGALFFADLASVFFVRFLIGAFFFAVFNTGAFAAAFLEADFPAWQQFALPLVQH